MLVPLDLLPLLSMTSVLAEDEEVTLRTGADSALPTA